ncbi:MAG: class I adenylate-forming enzyme family protein [archaeon]
MKETDTPRTIPEALGEATERGGDDPFVRYHDDVLTYESLDRRSTALAHGLIESGIDSTDSVGLYLYNSLPYVTLYVALSKIGATVVPVDTRFEGETLEYVLDAADVEAVFVDSRTREQYGTIRENSTIPAEYFVGSADRSGTLVPIEELRTDDYRKIDSDRDGSDRASITFVQRDPADPPRGVVLPQYSYVNTGREVSHLFDVSRDDRLYTTLPLYSIFTFQVGVMGSLLSTTEIVIDDPFDPSTFWENVTEYDASILLYLGRMLSVLNNQASDRASRSNPAEVVVGHGFSFGTDETLIEEFEERFDVTVYEGYGTTETGTIATYNRPGERKLGSSGTPVSYTEIDVVDDDDWPVDPGNPGEIVVRPTRSNTMMQEYLGDPEATVDVFENQWLHTGDIGYVDEDGYLHFVANENNSIYRGKIAGNVSSLEIESVIDSHPSVAESAVVGVETGDGNEAIKAVVVPEDGSSINPVELCRHCEKRLPRLKVPRYIDVHEELPRTATGKIRKPASLTGLADSWDRESGYEFSR